MKRHAGHHDEEYDYELYEKLIMKLKEFEIDELPFTRMADRNTLSPTVIKINATQGMIFTRPTSLQGTTLECDTSPYNNQYMVKCHTIICNPGQCENHLKALKFFEIIPSFTRIVLLYCKMSTKTLLV